MLRHGSLPVVWNADDPAAALRSYVQLYLKEEIKGEALVRRDSVPMISISSARGSTGLSFSALNAIRQPDFT